MWYSMLIYKTASEIVSLLRRGDISQEEIIKASSSDVSLPMIPAELYTNDLNLLNPSNWSKL